MKNYLILILSFVFHFNLTAGNPTGSLRLDYVHAGNATGEYIAIHRLVHDPHWGGYHSGPFENMEYGNYKFEVFNHNTGIKLFTRGYSTLFREWQTTDEAAFTSRAFEESLVMPFPESVVDLVIFSRDRENHWDTLFQMTIDPKDISIDKNRTVPFPTSKIHDAGSPSDKLDVVFIAEGYTSAEMKKFHKDAARFRDYLLGCAPFDQVKDDINIWTVASVSDESGPDLPGDSLWKRTILNSHFYTFGSERYLTVPSVWRLHDIAANAPCDQAVVIVNSDKYGGGGIYNFFTVATSGHQQAAFLLVHEFGHSFAGLADEYYTSEVAYADFYDLGTEPWEPNITTLVDFGSKWQDMLDPDTPVPTPPTADNKDKIGVFEGGGYVAKGVYRPVMDCTMKSVRYNDFCPVCRKAILKAFDFYTQH